jgi:hypothetical protein
MHCRRFFAALAAAMLLVVYSGCGGEEKNDSSSTTSGGPTQAKERQQPGGQSASAGGPSASAEKGPIDVAWVTPDDFAAIVIRPQRIAQSPLVDALLKDEPAAEAIKSFGIAPSDVEQVAFLLSRDPKHPALADPMNTVIIVRFSHDVDAKTVLTKLQQPGPSGPEPIMEVKLGGKVCLDLGTGNVPMAYVPRKDTIVLTAKENMEKVISIAEPKGPLWERLKKADADNDIIVVLEPGAYPDFDKAIDEAKKSAPPDFDLDPLKTVRGGTATFSLTASAMLRAVLDAKDAEAAGKVEELLKQTLKLAGAELLLAKQGIPKEAQAMFLPFVKLADEVLAGAKTTRSGGQVRLEVKRPASLEAAGASVVGAVRESVAEARAAARRTQQANNMRQIGLAMLNYEAVNRHFPPAAIVKDGKPLLSWRVAVLPLLGETDLFKQFHLDEPWDSAHNLEVAKTMPAVYQSPDGPGEGKTRVMVFTGKGAAFDGGKTIGFADIRDGTSATIMCVEAGADKAVPWTKPEDLPFDPQKPSAALGKVSPDGFLAAFFDGHVQRLKVDDPTLKALITPNGGEAIDMP